MQNSNMIISQWRPCSGSLVEWASVKTKSSPERKTQNLKHKQIDFECVDHLARVFTAVNELQGRGVLHTKKVREQLHLPSFRPSTSQNTKKFFLQSKHRESPKAWGRASTAHNSSRLKTKHAIGINKYIPEETHLTSRCISQHSNMFTHHPILAAETKARLEERRKHKAQLRAESQNRVITPRFVETRLVKGISAERMNTPSQKAKREAAGTTQAQPTFITQHDEPIESILYHRKSSEVSTSPIQSTPSTPYSYSLSTPRSRVVSFSEELSQAFFGNMD